MRIDRRTTTRQPFKGINDSCTLYGARRFVIECRHDRHEVVCGRHFSDENANTVGDRYRRPVRSSWFDGLLR